MGKKTKIRFRDTGMKITDPISESLETILWVKKIIKFFDADADPRNLFDPGSGIL
jgi:hypothetical protein